MCLKFQIICILEAHGDEQSLRAMLPKCCRTHELFSSNCVSAQNNNALGGIAILIVKEVMNILKPSTREHIFIVVEPGRAIRLELNAKNDMTARWYFIHSYGFSCPTITHLIRMVEGDILITKNDLTRNALGLIGDLNEQTMGIGCFLFPNPTIRKQILYRTLSRPPNRPVASKFNKLFEKFIEIDTPSPSHYVSPSPKGHQN